MFGNSPKDDSKYIWTEHAKFKLKQYGLSAQRIKRVLRAPQRKEEGIVKNTVAMMQPVSTKTMAGKPVWKQEIWVMYQAKIKNKYPKADKIRSLINNGGPIKIISAWRYPGVSPKKNPIPEEILREVEEMVV